MNNWKLKQIPKKLFLYWGKNKKLSFMRYMTVYSFVQLNPDWEIFVYYPLYPCKKETWNGLEQKSNVYDGQDYFDKLTSISDNITLISFDANELIGIGNNTPEVFKSDILRLVLLTKYGGVWSDFDIFYTNPVTEMYINKEQNNHINFFYSHHFGHHSIGFLLSSKNNLTFDFLCSMVDKNYDEKNYQSLGSNMFEKYLPYSRIKNGSDDFNTKTMNIPFETVYPVQWFDTHRLYDLDAPKHMTNTIGVHWFAGAEISSEYEAKINENSISDIKLIKDMVECYENSKSIS